MEARRSFLATRPQPEPHEVVAWNPIMSKLLWPQCGHRDISVPAESSFT